MPIAPTPVRAVALRFGAQRFTIVTDDDRELSLAYETFPLLRRATRAQRRAGKIVDDGLAFRWEEADADLLLASLLAPTRLRVRVHTTPWSVVKAQRFSPSQLAEISARAKATIARAAKARKRRRRSVST